MSNLKWFYKNENQVCNINAEVESGENDLWNSYIMAYYKATY